jgi:hypothetical protein
MQMLLANIDAGTQLVAPAFTMGTTGIGTFGTYFYSVVQQTMTQNLTPVICGESTFGTIMKSAGSLGTCVLSWTPSGVGSYTIYKGTANGATGTYMFGYVSVNGTLGTWTDPNQTAMGTGSALGSFQMAWTQSIVLPPVSAYAPAFANNLIIQTLYNYNTVISGKKKTYSAALSYTQIGSQNRYDLMTAFNWQAGMRFFPMVPEDPAVYFNVYWASDFNFTFLNSSINGGYAGNVKLVGIEGLTSITEVV